MSRSRSRKELKSGFGVLKRSKWVFCPRGIKTCGNCDHATIVGKQGPKLQALPAAEVEVISSVGTFSTSAAPLLSPRAAWGPRRASRWNMMGMGSYPGSGFLLPTPGMKKKKKCEQSPAGRKEGKYLPLFQYSLANRLSESSQAENAPAKPPWAV